MAILKLLFRKTYKFQKYCILSICPFFQGGMTKQQVKYLLLANNAETPRRMCREGYDVEESPRRLLVRFVYTYEYGDIRGLSSFPIIHIFKCNAGKNFDFVLEPPLFAF